MISASWTWPMSWSMVESARDRVISSISLLEGFISMERIAAVPELLRMGVEPFINGPMILSFKSLTSRADSRWKSASITLRWRRSRSMSPPTPLSFCSTYSSAACPPRVWTPGSYVMPPSFCLLSIWTSTPSTRSTSLTRASCGSRKKLSTGIAYCSLKMEIRPPLAEPAFSVTSWPQ